MLEISRFYGLVIKLLFNDDEQHHTPRVHVKCGEYQASVGFDGEVIAGRFPVKQYRILAAWLVIHEDEPYEAWNLAVAGKPFGKIDPLN